MGAQSSLKYRFDTPEGAKNLASIELVVRIGTLDKN